MIKRYRNGCKLGPFKFFWKRQSITLFAYGKKRFYYNIATGTLTF